MSQWDFPTQSDGQPLPAYIRALNIVFARLAQLWRFVVRTTTVSGGTPGTIPVWTGTHTLGSSGSTPSQIGAAMLAVDSGADGDIGPPGPRGADGPPGPAGAAGASGATGPAGPVVIWMGDDGADGERGPPGATGATGPAGGGGGSATTVEVNLGSTAVFSGKFTITDAAISSSSKVLCWQAPGPYTSKGTRADEAEMQPVSVIATESGSGSAVVKWQTPPQWSPSPRATAGGQPVSAVVPGLKDLSAIHYGVMQRKGMVRGNVKFTYVVYA